jgi:hypothetical protein
MGFRISWMATQAAEPEVLLALKARKSGASGEYIDFDLSIGSLGNGWIIIWSEDEEYFDDPRSLILSSNFPLIACWVNETVMHSRVRKLSNGKEEWAIWHEGDENIAHIDSSGNPPAELTKLIAEAREQQALDNEVDYLFDVPLLIAASICGFKHDEFMDDTIAFDEISIEAESGMANAPPTQKGSWFSRLFGAK